MATLQVSRIRAAFATVFWIEGVVWALSAYLHTGARVSFLPAVFADPPISGAPEVEGVCAVALLIAALLATLASRRTWPAAMLVHAAVAVTDVIPGVVSSPETTSSWRTTCTISPPVSEAKRDGLLRSYRF